MTINIGDVVEFYMEIPSETNRLFREGNYIILQTARGKSSGIDWTELTKKQLEWNNIMSLRGETEIEMLPFDHPLWIVYSSGTTGNPKPIVHGHGGILMEMTKQSLHMDLTKNDHFCPI